jgi:hypothetical protein
MPTLRFSNMSWITRARALAAACAMLCAAAQAQSNLINVVHTIAGTNRAVPVEHSFTIATAGTYQVTLTDLGAALTPTAPLSSVKLAITSGSTIVGTPLTATPPLTGGSESTQFSATPGTYIIHVIGVPGTVAGSGPIGILVTNTADGSQVQAYSDTLALPPGSLPVNEAVINDAFTVSAAGNYQVTLSDLQLPQSLPTLQLAITQQGGSSLIANMSAAGSTTVALATGVTYRIFAVGQASTTQNAGLFSAVVSPAAGGSPIYSKTVPVGSAALLGTQTLSVDTYTLGLTDLIYPSAPLAQLGAAVTLNGAAVAQLGTAGTKSFTGTAATYQIFAVGVPSTPPGTGSYAVTLQGSSGGAPALSVAQAVATPGGAVSGYSFSTSVTSGGTYSAALADFSFAAPFTSLSAAIIQGASTLGTMSSSAGTASFSASAGPLTLLVFAQPGTGGSLFGVNVTASGGTTPMFQTTQGVGELFGTQKVTVTSAGTYLVTVSDVAFPVALTSLSAIVTQGTSRLGSIFGGGTFSFAATPGDYYVTLVAQPGGTDSAGTYAMTVGPQPPAPVVNLQSSATSVTSGGTVTLTWSSQNATACTSTGGSWTGSQSLSGSVTTAAITSATTYTLTCTGAGGSTSASVAVSITAPSSSGHGGGGAISTFMLSALAGMLTLRVAAIRPWVARRL